MDNGSNKPQPPRRRDYSDPTHYSAIPPRASRGRHQGQERRRQQPDEQFVEAPDDYDERAIYEEEEEEFAPPARTARAGRPRQPESERSFRVRRRRRSVWPAFLAGCGLSIFGLVVVAAVVVVFALRSMQGGNPLPGLGGHAFTRSDTQSINLPTLSRLQVCDKVGNVSISVDPNASSTKVSAKKTVQAGSQGEAEQKFKQIMVEIQPPGTVQNKLTCPKPALTPTPSSGQGGSSDAQSLVVNVTVPGNDNTIMPDAANSVDINILIPQTSLPKNGPTMFVDVEAPLGNVAVSGLQGVLHIRSGTGNIVVKNAILAGGSDIETGEGNITFGGRLAVPPPGTSPPADGTFQFTLHCEKGDIDATLPADLNLTLDTYTNVGTIKSEFGTRIDSKGDGGSVDYRGPLNPNAALQPGKLAINTSVGKIVIHKQQSLV
ncbi:MAG: hypothetical protein J2P37_09095 [Ktedonobacteraceae bacterium]|nr:hypothetical protein [Ktedonobacteraceae bacterium]